MRKHVIARVGLVLALLVALQTSASASLSLNIGRATSVRQPRLANVKMISYFPSRHAFSAMWTHWDPGQINIDFGRIQGLNANTVRLMVDPDVFGFPRPRPRMVQRLTYAIGLAATHNLRVQLTLFDQWNDFTEIRASERWVSRLLRPLRGDGRIQSIEMMNEMPVTPESIAWAQKLIPYTRTAAVTVPITISPAADLVSLSDLQNQLRAFQPDFYSYHYYNGVDIAERQLKMAMDIVAPKELFVGETGLPSSYGGPNAPIDPSQERQQMYYLAGVQAATEVLGLGPAAPWIFQDMTFTSFGSNAPNHAFHMGLLRVDGTEKPAAAWLRSYFGDR